MTVGIRTYDGAAARARSDLFNGLLDDAALFPPGNAPMADAVRAHLAHRKAAYAHVVGPFVCPDDRLRELSRELAAYEGSVLDVAVVVRRGPAAVPDAVDLVTRDETLRLRAVEVSATRATDVVDEIVRLFARVLPAGTAGSVELPLTAEGVDELAGTPYSVKIRTGGTEAAAFPDESALARVIAACVCRGRAFKCTAGLHHAVRHTDPATGFEHHGFLNVMAAIDAALRGGDSEDLAEMLRSRDGEDHAGRLRRLTPAEAGALRRTFLSFGTCSVVQPVDDLAALGLL